MACDEPSQPIYIGLSRQYFPLDGDFLSLKANAYKLQGIYLPLFIVQPASASPLSQLGQQPSLLRYRHPDWS